MKTIQLTALMIAYIFALKPLGFPIAICIFLAIAIRIFGYRKWLPALAMAAVITVISYVSFVLWLSVPLPLGYSKKSSDRSAHGPFQRLIHGFSVALTPMNLLFGFLGAVIEPSSASCRPRPLGAMALLLSLTYGFDPTAGMICSPAFISARCTAARRPPSCSHSREAASVITVIEATRWPAAAAPGRARGRRGRLVRRPERSA